MDLVSPKIKSLRCLKWSCRQESAHPELQFILKMTKSAKQLAKELGLLRKRPLSISSPRCLRKRQKNDQRFSHLIVIDFESTCWENDKLRPQEIIEFPAVLLNTQTGELEDEFHFYVQPSEFPTLSSFCQQLTGISQDTVDEGIPLSMCLRRFVAWLGKLKEKKGIVCVNDGASSTSSGGQNEAVFVTWSDWDLGVCLFYETKRKQITWPAAFNCWIDLRATYRRFYSRRPEGLNGALKELGIEFEGRQHSGLDDAKNTAKLAWRMICDGCIMTITKTLKRGKQGFVERKTVTSAVQQSAQTTLTNLQGKSLWVGSSSKTSMSIAIDEDKRKENRSTLSSKTTLGLKHTQLTEGNKKTISSALKSFNKTPSSKASVSKRDDSSFKYKFCDKENIPPSANASPVNKSIDPRKSSPRTCKYGLNRRNVSASVSNGCIQRSPRRAQEKTGSAGSKKSPGKSLVQESYQNPQVTSVLHKSENDNKSLEGSSSKRDFKHPKPFDDDTPRTSRLSNPLRKQGLVHVSSPNKSFGTSPQNVSFQNPSGAIAINCPRLQNITPPSNTNAKVVALSSNPSALKPSEAFKTPTQSSFQSGQKLSGAFKTPAMGSKLGTSSMRVTPPLCMCGRRSKRRQVQNCGPNMGRLFFACSIGQSLGTPATKSGCGFFQWESPATDSFKRRDVSVSTPRQFPHLPTSYIPVPCRSLGVRSK